MSKTCNVREDEYHFILEFQTKKDIYYCNVRISPSIK